MRKFLALLLIVLFCSCANGSDIKIPPQTGGGEVRQLTEQQKATLQMDADIFCQCVLETAAPFIVFGFSSEVALYFGMKECTPEGENLEKTMKDSGLSKEEALANFDTLMNGMLKFVDMERNKRALENMKQWKKKMFMNN